MKPKERFLIFLEVVALILVLIFSQVLHIAPFFDTTLFDEHITDKVVSDYQDNVLFWSMQSTFFVIALLLIIHMVFQIRMKTVEQVEISSDTLEFLKSSARLHHLRSNKQFDGKISSTLLDALEEHTADRIFVMAATERALGPRSFKEISTALRRDKAPELVLFYPIGLERRFSEVRGKIVDGLSKGTRSPSIQKKISEQIVARPTDFPHGMECVVIGNSVFFSLASGSNKARFTRMHATDATLAKTVKRALLDSSEKIALSGNSRA